MKLLRNFARSFTILTATTAMAPTIWAADLTRPVKVTEGEKVETYLGTQFGQTLYTFDLDKNGKSACVAVCAEKWPPLLVDANEAAGLKLPLATIARDSGLLQVTLNGHPVYTFFLDHAEGDDKGDGLGDVWHDIDVK